MSLNIEAVKNVYDNSPLAFCVIKVITDKLGFTQDFLYEYVNEAFASLMNISSDRLQGNTYYSVFKNADKKLTDLYGSVAFTGKPNTYTRYICEIKKYVSSRCYQIAPGYCGCLLLEAKEKKELELYRSSNMGGVFTVRLDSQFTLLYANDLYLHIHEFEPQEIIGKSCTKFVHPQDLDHVRNVLNYAKEHNLKNTEWEMRIVTGKGKIKHMFVSGSFGFVDGKEVYNGYVTDISKLKETEQALHASEEKFRIATENTDISFWTYCYASHTIIQTNSSKMRHGFDMIVENVPQSLIDCGHIRKDSAEAFLEMYQKLENGAKTACGDFWSYDEEKKQWWCEHIGQFDTIFALSQTATKCLFY